MTRFIGVKDRAGFDDFLDKLNRNHLFVADTETNGLRYYRGHKMISLAVYFPDIDIVYNLPFRQGQGDFDIDTSKNFSDMSWSTKVKKEMFLAELYNNVVKRNFRYNNLPEEWIEEIKPFWANKHHIYHNARFDMHILNDEGFPTPRTVSDTMIGLHVVLEDWFGTKFNAPKTGLKGWERNKDGSLTIRSQYGNRQLKWVAAMLQHTGQIPNELDATAGEAELKEACDSMADYLATFICEHNIDHPMIEKMLYANVKKKGLHDSGVREQQIDKVRRKIEINPKKNMWLLPVEKVAYYAMLDVVLTWHVHLWCMDILQRWDNVDLYMELCAIQRSVAFPMEVNGALLDQEECDIQIQALEVKRDAIQDIFNHDTELRGYSPFSIDSYSKLRDWFNCGLLNEPCHHLLPEWYQGGQTLKLYTNTFIEDTRKETLKDHEGHPAIMLVQEYRKIKTSLDFLNKWRGAVDPNGIIHPSMNVTGTVAGRFSSSGDAGNWQNIPDRSGYTIKRAIVAPENWLICANDYGQLEARIAAWEAETNLRAEGVHNLTPTMTNLFNGIYDMAELRKINPNLVEHRFLKGGSVDMHSFTREVVDVRNVVYGDKSDDEILTSLGYHLDNDPSIDGMVDAHCRQIAKTLNFGLLYSGTKYMVRTLLRIDLEVADELVNRWRHLFPVFEIAQEYYMRKGLEWREIPAASSKSQYVTQRLTGRHRKLARYATNAVQRKGGQMRQFNPKLMSAKKCWNNIVQGTGGMLLPRAFNNYLNDSNGGSEYVKPFAIIHDAIEYRVRVDHLREVHKIMQCMVDVADIDPSLTVDLVCGTNWQDLEPVIDLELWVKTHGQEGY